MTAVTDVIDELHRRGLIAQSTDEAALRAHLAEGPVTYYCGFDPTAPSLHVGNLMQFIRAGAAARRAPAARAGRRCDRADRRPRGDAERTLNDREVVAGWVERIRAQVAPFLDLPAERTTRPRSVNNLDWTAPLSAIDFLRDVGKHFRVNRMLAKEAVRARLTPRPGISYTEFSYQLLQAHDYFELHQRYGCALQFGGSDQWGNITAGVDLIRRTRARRCTRSRRPLVTKADGTKFGKTEGGAVWLDPELTSPYAFYQFWLNIDDADARATCAILRAPGRGSRR